MSVAVEGVESRGNGTEGGPAGSTTVPDTPTIPDMEQKHQLQNKWKFWYFENMKDRKWEDNLRVVSDFYTVEDFWSIFNHIKCASDLRTGCSYFVFKDGIKPMWEDPINVNGGRWLITFEKRRGENRVHIDELWLEVLLCLIGEAFDDDGDDICGVVVDIRPKFDKISLWTRNCRETERIMNIGQIVRSRLGLKEGSMTYESHQDTSMKTSSSAKSMLQL